VALGARAAGAPPPHELDFDVTPSARMCGQGSAPAIDANTHRLRLTGLVGEELEYSLQELAQSFRVFSVPGVLECDDGGVGCPLWTGMRLADLLGAARVQPAATFVSSTGAAGAGRAIPLAKAMDADTLIAWAMNGAALHPEQGFPLRLVVPGWSARASTRWLHSLAVVGATPDAARASPPNSIITSPAPGARLKSGAKATVRGHAWVGEGDLARVEVSTDGGESWGQALLWQAGGRHAWRRFTWDFEPSRTGRTIVVARARDSAGNVQQAAHRVEIDVEREALT
jgi:DMSO/TMAO reductase YedYZ molybdopterin-dependent catalytic subunit